MDTAQIPYRWLRSGVYVFFRRKCVCGGMKGVRLKFSLSLKAMEEEIKLGRNPEIQLVEP